MSQNGIDAAIAALADDFALFSDWEERYAHVIELGRTLEPLSEAEHSEANKVRGCASQVWLVSEPRGGKLYFRGDSDAFIVRGLIAVLLSIFSGRTPREIQAADPRAVFDSLGLASSLTPQRSNGMIAMIERMKREAAASA
ncbi:MAG: SufE family protein [Hyphomonadaceae bacterium]